jgi:ADP-heptose:LPS heptosyltransferase
MSLNKILIVRTDRVGDVLLTTPVSTALRQAFPQAKIAWLVRPYTAPLLENNPDVDQVLIDRGQSAAALAAELKKEQFDAAIVAFPRWRITWALWRAGVRIRIGPASKLYSILFTHRPYQHRSEGEKHEADYNLELLEPLGVSFKRHPTRFVLTEAERRMARRILESHRISFSKPVVVLHPGSGGSSARWPLTHFMALGDKLLAAGCDVVVTGGPGEDYQYMMIDQMHHIPVFIAAGSVTLRELAAIYSWADLVVTNSTGPLHLAVALEVPTVSIYSPIPTCHPQRWGPYPAFVEHGSEHQVLVAPIVEGQEDMGAVMVEDVWRHCAQRLGNCRGRPLRLPEIAGGHGGPPLQCSDSGR